MLELPQWGNSNKYTKYIFLEISHAMFLHNFSLTVTSWAKVSCQSNYSYNEFCRCIECRYKEGWLYTRLVSRETTFVSSFFALLHTNPLVKRGQVRQSSLPFQKGSYINFDKTRLTKVGFLEGLPIPHEPCHEKNILIQYADKGGQNWPVHRVWSSPSMFAYRIVENWP